MLDFEPPKWTEELVDEHFKQYFFLSDSVPDDLKYKNWRDMPILVFDLETCSANPFDLENRIVQFCGILYRYGVEVERLNLYIDPQRKIPEEATAVHGITFEMVAAEPRFQEVWPQIQELMSKAVIIAGHNMMGFDYPLLQNQCRIHKCPIPHMPIIDTLVFFRRVRNGFSKTGNEAMGVHYRVAKTSAVKHNLAKAHDAEVDVEMTAASMFAMAEQDIPWCLKKTLDTQWKAFCSQQAYLMNKYRKKKDDKTWIDFPSPRSKSYWKDHLKLKQIEEIRSSQ